MSNKVCWLFRCKLRFI